MSDRATSARQTVFSSQHVLVVEDNLVNQRVALGLLVKQGHRVTIASNGREALTALRDAGPFDLVLMDVQMPEMDGVEVTTRIRAQEQGTGRHQRIIAMTAHAMKGDRERFLAAGMDAYLPKPIDPQALFDLMGFAPGGRPPANMAAARSLDADELRQRLGDDDELIADVIRLFLEDCPARVEAIAAALEAGDTARVRAVSHTLKGSASTLAAHGVANAACALEFSEGSEEAAARFSALVEEVDRVTEALHAFPRRR